MDLETYKLTFNSDDAAPGWDAIDNVLTPVYGAQEPKHWGTLIKHFLGGPDPLDGISAYESKAGGVDHLHFCTYGFSNLYYDEEACGGEFSRFGFELTFRLKRPFTDDENPTWVCGLLQNLARYVFETGNWFEAFHWLPANGPICRDNPTEIVGLVFARDPELPAQDTPHGKVEFLQMFGVIQSELDSIMSKEKSAADILQHHRETNPLLITDLSRCDEGCSA